jgi:hypothetical protein
MAFGARGSSVNQLALRPHYWSSLRKGRALPDCISSHLSPPDLCAFGTAVEHTRDRILRFGAIETRSVRAASLHHAWHVLRIKDDRLIPETTELHPGQRLSLGLNVHPQIMFSGMLGQCIWPLPHARVRHTNSAFLATSPALPGGGPDFNYGRPCRLTDDKNCWRMRRIVKVDVGPCRYPQGYWKSQQQILSLSFYALLGKKWSTAI